MDQTKIIDLEQGVVHLHDQFCSDKEIQQLYHILDPALKDERFLKSQQIALSSSNGEDFFDGLGSLYDYDLKKMTRNTSDYTILNKTLQSSPLADIFDVAKEVAYKAGRNIGRIRLMRLKPKTCLSLHVDLDEWRLHIPLNTNPGAFFVVNNRVLRMPKQGSLYLLNTRDPHTAVNASFQIRDHLVFDTYNKN